MSTVMDVFKLPIEIEEKILSMLDVNSLLAATDASPEVWTAVAKERLFRQFCLKHISEDVLSEMLAGRKIDEVKDGSIWGSFLRRWARTIDVCITDEAPSVPKATELSKAAASHGTHTHACECTSFTVSGNVIITSDSNNRLIWYRYDTSSTARGGTMEKLFIVECTSPVAVSSPLTVGGDKSFSDDDDDNDFAEHDAIVAVSVDGLAIYAMPNRQCQRLMSSLGHRLMPKVSVEGNQFATYNHKDQALTMWRVDAANTMSTINDAQVTVKSERIGGDVCEQLVLLEHTRDFKLWKNRLTVLLDDGSTATWDRHSRCLRFRTNVNNYVSLFRYPFRSFMYRRLTFVDVTSARAMLGYWHINTGPHPYWLVSSGDRFEQLDASGFGGDEMSAVCVRMTLIAIGTVRGRCYLYRLLEADSEILNVLSAYRRPLAVFETTGHGSTATGTSRIDGLELSFGRNCCLLCITNDDHCLFIVKLSTKNLK